MLGIIRGAVLIVAPIAGLGVAGVYNYRTHADTVTARAQQEPEVLWPPLQWVSFSADLSRIAEDDGQRFVGRSYQDANGSTRNETGPSLDKITSVYIKNVPQSMSYLWSPEVGWRSQPMILPPDGWRPQPWKYNPARMTKEPQLLEGYQVIGMLDRPGVTSYRVPDLNFFVAAKTMPCQFNAKATCGVWHSNIKLGPQPEKLFLPPSDAVIVALKTPGGIVYMAPQH